MLILILALPLFSTANYVECMADSDCQPYEDAGGTTHAPSCQWTERKFQPPYQTCNENSECTEHRNGWCTNPSARDICGRGGKAHGHCHYMIRSHCAR